MHSKKEREINQDRVYLAPLDGLRFVAILAVMANHVVPPRGSWLYVMHERGWIGVDLFFTLSSFLFFTLLRAEHDRTGRISVGNFFYRRLLRIYPLMVLLPFALMAGLGLMADRNAWRELLTIALFADNLLWFPTFARAIPYAEHLWTLSFEFQVYLVIPALFLVCARIGRNKSLVLLFLIWLACLCARAHYVDLAVRHPVIYFSPLLRPESVILGAVIAMVAPTARPRSLWAFTVLVAAFVAYLSLSNVNVVDATNVLLYPVVALICGALLWLTLKDPRMSWLLSRPALVYLGKLSFGIYVFHPVAKHVAERLLSHTMVGAASPVALYWATFALTLVLAIAAAAISYRFIERPFLVLKERRAAVLSRPI